MGYGYKIVILGLYRDNGKENGNYRDYGAYIGVYGWLSKLGSLFGSLNIGIIGTIFGFYGDNGEENGNYYVGVIYIPY